MPETMMEASNFWNNFYSPTKVLPVIIAPPAPGNLDWLIMQTA